MHMFVLDNLGREIQEASNLCWAAVSTMAVRAFADAEFVPPTQRLTVTYRASDIATLAQLKRVENSTGVLHNKLVNFTARCGVKGNCNTTSVDLHMFDVRSVKVPPEHALLPQHFFIEIALRGCPVPIRWRFLQEAAANGPALAAEHALIVTGYNPLTNELRIFDPAPANDPDDNVADLRPEEHERWIPYNVYLNPQNDNGLDVIAVHEFDEYMLQRVGDPTVLTSKFRYPALVRVSPGPARRENSVDFRQPKVPVDLLDAIEKVKNAYVVRKPNGDVIHGPYHTDRPIPIVAVRLAEIRNGKPHHELFKPDTSTVAVPVLNERGAMIDSFMMLHDRTGWKPGGYCNNRISAMLQAARKSVAETPEEPLYIVSIPELSTFYLAHGFYQGASITRLRQACMKEQLQTCGDTLNNLVVEAEREYHEMATLGLTLGSSRC